MTQRQDSHPYMSKNQLNEYLASLRNDRPVEQPRGRQREVSSEDSEDRGSTPLVRALKERYGSGNTTAGYVDVGISKGRESPTKRALPPVPGPKSETSTGWRVSQKPEMKREERREEIPHPHERSHSPTKKNDFWTTGVVRPLPSAPYSNNQHRSPDPRDELRMPSIDSLSIDDSYSGVPSINSPSINTPSSSVPSVRAPSINVPSITVPSNSSQPSESHTPAAPEKSWPNIHVRSKSSAALLCSVCSKPIAGRIVTAIGSRFHPECFRCATCSTELVCHHYLKLTIGTCRILRT
jgi:LIM domain